ncbi:hypothetical protein ACFL6S_18465 [Candidatus Poribacteria bacterium]
MSDDELYLSKAIMILLLLAVILISVWFASQIPDPAIQAKANFFWALGLVGMGGVFLGILLSKVGVDFDVITYSRETVFGELPPMLKRVLVILPVVIGLFVFYNIGVSGSSAVIYDTIEMQVIELGPWGNAFASFLFAVTEEFGLVALFTGLVYFAFYKIFKENGLVAFLLTLVIVPAIFAYPYHILRYGSSDWVAVYKVFGMTLMSVGWMLIMRNILLGIFVHGFNNAAIIFFSKSAVSPAVVFLELAPVIAVIGIAVAVYVWWYRRSDGGNT